MEARAAGATGRNWRRWYKWAWETSRTTSLLARPGADIAPLIRTLGVIARRSRGVARAGRDRASANL
jgi:hypothetical protein